MQRIGDSPRVRRVLVGLAIFFSALFLLLPLVAAAVITASGVLGPVAVPTAVQWVAYALIGAQVGLRFTRDSLRSIARMLPVVLALIVALGNAA